jgi:hypothetical protein
VERWQRLDQEEDQEKVEEQEDWRIQRNYQNSTL